MTLPAHFLVSDSGPLFDTRKANWHNLPPVRKNYAYYDRDLSTGTQSLRAAIRNPYAWPGGYELVFITSDGGALCHKCVKENYRAISWSMRHEVNDGWRVTGIDSTANFDESCMCDHCSRELSPYVEEEEAA